MFELKLKLDFQAVKLFDFLTNQVPFACGEMLVGLIAYYIQNWQTLQLANVCNLRKTRLKFFFFSF